MTTSTLASCNGTHSPANPEVPAQARRRTLPAAYQLCMLCEADGCAPGELGALLRRERRYSSQLATWRKQRREGTLTALAPRRRGRPLIVAAGATALAVAQAENARLTQQLAAAEAIIEIQKKSRRTWR